MRPKDFWDLTVPQFAKLCLDEAGEKDEITRADLVFNEREINKANKQRAK